MHMAAAVAGQEDHVDAGERAEEQLVGRFAPGRIHALPARILESGNVVDAGAADDAENGFGHE